MKRLLVLVLLLLAATSGCAGGTPKGFTGTVALFSGSMPPPHSWKRVAQVDGRQVTITETGKDARPARTRTLTDDDLRRIDALLRGFPRDHAEDEGKVGGGYAIVGLEADDGDRLERKPLSGREGYAVAEQLFAVLAGQ